MINCAAFVTLAFLCALKLSAQSRTDCDVERADSTRKAYDAGRYDDAIRLGKLTAANCSATAAYILYNSHRRAGSLEAFRAFARALAEAGNSEFAYYLAADLAERLFVPRYAESSLAEAVRFYELAYKNGHDLSALDLGRFYYLGRFSRGDVTSSRADPERAREYFRACQHSATVGRECSEGVGLALLRTGRQSEGLARLREAEAFEALCAIYRFGLLGVRPDSAETSRIERLLNAYKESQLDRNAFSIRSLSEDLRAYQSGDALAARELALRFNDLSLHGAPNDGRVYVDYLREAAIRGNAWAASDLGDAYLEGSVARRDFVTAYMYYNIALDRGDTELQNRVRERQERLATQMTRDDIAVAQRLTREFPSPAPRKRDSPPIRR
jgi:TPR repeat protein